MMWTTLPRSKLSPQLSGWSGGKGPELLLIHGVGMRADYWSNLVPTLRAYFSLTIIDLPGHGESAFLPNDHPSLEHYTDVVKTLIDDAMATPIVMGHSLGALITMDLAARYSTAVSGIAVLNAVYRRDSEAHRAINTRLEGFSATTVSNPNATLQRWFGTNPNGVEREANDVCKRWLQGVNPKGYHQAYTAFATSDAPSDDALSGYRCPALFMTGSHEPNSTPAMSQAMSSLVPHSRCVIVDQAKHMMSMTHGADVSNAVIGLFTSEEKRNV